MSDLSDERFFDERIDVGAVRHSAEDAMAAGHAVSIVPDFASAEECRLLCNSAATAARAKETKLQPGVDGCTSLARHRFAVADHFDASARKLSDQLVMRALSFLQKHRPLVGKAMLQCDASDASDIGSSLSDLVHTPGLTFSSGEPAVNSYSSGGQFTPHKDQMCLTVLLTLSAPDEYTGGGTAFWPPSLSIDDAKQGLPPSLVIKAPIGAALLWSGVVTHAGRAVESGKRCVWVASFSPKKRACLIHESAQQHPSTTPASCHVTGDGDHAKESEDTSEEEDTYTEEEKRTIAAAKAKAYANRAARRAKEALEQQRRHRMHTPELAAAVR